MEINWRLKWQRNIFRATVVYNKFHLNIRTDVDANSHEINSITQAIEHQPSEFADDKNSSVRY